MEEALSVQRLDAIDRLRDRAPNRGVIACRETCRVKCTPATSSICEQPFAGVTNELVQTREVGMPDGRQAPELRVSVNVVMPGD